MTLPKRIKIKWSRCKSPILQEGSSHSNSRSRRRILMLINHRCFCSCSIYLLEVSRKCKSIVHNLNLDKQHLHNRGKCLWCHHLNFSICLWELHHLGWCKWDNHQVYSLCQWNQCLLLEVLHQLNPWLNRLCSLLKTCNHLKFNLLRVYHHSHFLNRFLGSYPCQLILTDRLKWSQRKSDLKISKEQLNKHNNNSRDLNANFYPFFSRCMWVYKL